MFMLPRFREDDFTTSIAWTLYSSYLLELMLKHFTQTLQMCGMDTVFLLFHSFCVQVTVADTDLSVFSFLPWKNMSAEMTRLQVKACALCGAALCFKVGLTNLCSVAGNWLFKSESRRLYEMDAQLPRLYVIPMTSLLGKLSVVQAGNTGTIPYSMRGRAAECYPGGKCDSSEGKGDGSRLYYVNPWTMRWSQII